MENINSLFVYGSLRRGFHNPAYNYISQYFKLVGEAKVKGKMYDMGNYPVGVSSAENLFLKGELYELKNPADFAWAIGQLDAYEGVNPDEDEVQLYERAVTEVYFGNEQTKAWIYWYIGNTDNKPLIPSGDIFDFRPKSAS